MEKLKTIHLEAELHERLARAARRNRRSLRQELQLQLAFALQYDERRAVKGGPRV